VSHRETFSVEAGPGPLIATAIHDGHALSPEIAELMFGAAVIDALERKVIYVQTYGRSFDNVHMAMI
jgi:hypothetical protein